MSPTRVVYKVSGESLSSARGGMYSHMADENFHFVAAEISSILDAGYEVLVVVGGGNLYRGAERGRGRLDRADADKIGMLATAMNALQLAANLDEAGHPARVMTRGAASGVDTLWSARDARAVLEQGRPIVIAGGLGVPFMSSDYPALHHAAEVDATAVLIAKHGIDGVYDADPKREPTARKFDELTCTEIIRQDLAVMDLAAVDLARRFGIEMHIFAADAEGAGLKALKGDHVGTVVHPR
ncbi:MAG: UMP kinase [Chloroflexota bacterium]|nr:UMP kinase [Chloroflexota bacterium]